MTSRAVFRALSLAGLMAAFVTAVTAPLAAEEGEDPIVFSKGAAIAYALYQRHETPGFFAVSLDGAVSHHAPYAGDWKDEPALVRIAHEAIDACEQAAGGVPCMTFARNGEIVMGVPYEIPHD